MAHSAADRSKAKYIRGKVRKKKTVTAGERAWLAQYERGTLPPVAEASVSREVKRERPPPSSSAVELRPIASDDDDDDDDDDDESESPEGEAHAPEAAKVCTIKECPACSGRDVKGPLVCVATGKEVWPPVSLNSARMIASFVFFVLGWVVKVANKLPEIVPPTELEREELAKSLVELIQRRFGRVALVDDIVSTAWSVTGYTNRARKVKALPKPRPEPVTLDSWKAENES